MMASWPNLPFLRATRGIDHELPAVSHFDSRAETPALGCQRRVNVRAKPCRQQVVKLVTAPPGKPHEKTQAKLPQAIRKVDGNAPGLIARSTLSRGSILDAGSPRIG
jgi:hypothetical protein